MIRTVSVIDYIMHTDEPFRDRFLERMKPYSLKEDVVEELKKYLDEIFVVVFSAGWCKDCVATVRACFASPKDWLEGEGLAVLRKTSLTVMKYGGYRHLLLKSGDSKWKKFHT